MVFYHLFEGLLCGALALRIQARMPIQIALSPPNNRFAFAAKSATGSQVRPKLMHPCLFAAAFPKTASTERQEFQLRQPAAMNTPRLLFALTDLLRPRA